MKKIFISILILIILCPLFVFAEEVEVVKSGRNAVLVEVSTGKVLYEKNKDEQVSVASLTKMMAQIIILEEVEKGNLKWDEKITTSANAAGYGGTQIYLEPGEVMTVEELMKGISMASANDATVALAERIAGSEEKFVDMMNEKAKQLGLKNTNFVNPTGLDEENHYSSAYDMALIGIELLKHEEIIRFSSLYEDYLRQDTPNKFWLVNTNKLIRTFDGADGLKTGFTNNAGYTMAVTAKRSGMRLLAVVLGEDVSKVRNQETTDLLNYGFNLYKVETLKKKGDVVDKLKISKGNEKEIDVILDSDVTVLEEKSVSNKKYTEKVLLDEVSLPIKKNDKVGILEIYDGNNKIGSYILVSSENVNKKKFLNIYFDNLKNIITGNLDI